MKLISKTHLWHQTIRSIATLVRDAVCPIINTSKCFLLGIFLLSSSAHAIDWPFFKADAARSGTTTDTVLGPGLELKWMGKAGDAGIVSYSSPIVAGDQAFISHSNGLVTAFDLSPNFAVQSDGSALPTFYAPTKSAAKAWQFRTNGSVYSSPAFAVSNFVRRVFVGTTSGTVYALKANAVDPQGEQLWRADLGGAFFASPIVADVTGVGPTLFVAAVTGDVYALNAIDGSVRWKIAMPGQVLASPVFDTPKQRLYLVDMRGNIRAFVASTGGVLWNRGSQNSFHATPALQGDVLYVVGRNGIVRSIDASALIYPAERNIFSTLTLPTGIVSSPAITSYLGKPRLLVLTHDGTLRAIDANVGGGGLTAAWTLAPKIVDAGGTASVSIAGTRAYVGTQDGTLRMIDVADGAVRFEQKLAGGAEIAPAVAQSSLLVASNDGALRAYGMPISSIRVSGQSTVAAGLSNSYVFEALDAAGNVVPTAAGPASVTTSLLPGQNQLQVVSTGPLNAGRGTMTLVRSPGNYLVKVSVVVAGKTYIGALTVLFVGASPTPTPSPSITPSDTLTPTATATATESVTPTLTQTSTFTTTETVSATYTSTPTATSTSVPTPGTDNGFTYYWFIKVQNRTGLTYDNTTVQLSDGTGFVDLASRIADNKIESDGSDIRIVDDQGVQVPFDLVNDPNHTNAILRFKVSHLDPSQEKIYRMDFGKPGVGFPAGYGTTAYLEQVYGIADSFEGTAIEGAKWTVNSGAPVVGGGQLSVDLPFDIQTLATLDTSYGGRYEFTGNGGNSEPYLGGQFNWQMLQDSSHYVRGYRNRLSGIGFEVSNLVNQMLPAQPPTPFGGIVKWAVISNGGRYGVTKDDGANDFYWGVFVNRPNPLVIGQTKFSAFGTLDAGVSATAIFQKIVAYAVRDNGPTATLLGDHPVIFDGPVTNDPVPETHWNQASHEEKLPLVQVPTNQVVLKGFPRPSDLLVSQGSLWVVDQQNAHVRRFDRLSLNPTGVFSQNLVAPEALAWDALHQWIWIADPGAHRVVAMDLDGSLVRTISQRGSEPLILPSGVAVDTNGLVYVVDRQAATLSCYHADGSYYWSRGALGYEANRFASPSRVAVGKNGMVHVSDPGNQRVASWDKNGYPIRQLPRLSAMAFNVDTPVGLAVDAKERLWFVDAAKGRLVCNDANGQLLGVGVEHAFTEPAGIFVEEDGTTWVADRGKGEVVGFRDGQAPTNPSAGDVVASSRRDSKELTPAKHWLPQEVKFLVAPNPAKRDVVIGIRLAQSAKVTVFVSNIAGETPYSIDLGTLPAGESVVQALLPNLASGIYLLSAQVEGPYGPKILATQKVAVLR